MFASIRRHQNYIWFIVVVVVIISFVIFFSPNARYRGNGGASDYFQGKTLYGDPITREEFVEANQEVRLRHYLQTGKPPARSGVTDRELERDTYFRLLIIANLKRRNIEVTEAAAGQAAATIIGSSSYDRFVKQFLQPEGFTDKDFRNFVSHEVGLRQLVAVAGLPGRLVVPEDAEELYRREHEKLLTKAAFFQASNYVSEVKITPGDVARFYTNSMALYRIPEKITVSYVAFGRSNFLAEAENRLNQVTNLNEQIANKYLELGTNSFRDTNGTVLSEAAAEEQIKQTQLDQLALLEAHKRAAEFANELYDLKSHHLQDFENLAAAKGKEVHETAPFALNEEPPALDVPPNFGEVAFALTPDDAIAFSPLVGSEAAYVIALNQRVPSDNSTVGRDSRESDRGLPPSASPGGGPPSRNEVLSLYDQRVSQRGSLFSCGLERKRHAERFNAILSQHSFLA